VYRDGSRASSETNAAGQRITREAADGSQTEKISDTGNTHPYTELDIDEDATGKIIAAKPKIDGQPDNGNNIDFSAVGQVLGSALGRALAPNNQFVQLAAGTVVGAVGQKLAQAFVASLKTDAASFNLESVFADFNVSIAGAGASSVASFLVAEIGTALHLDGFAGQLFDAAGGGFAGSVASQIATKMARDSISFAAAVGTLDFGAAAASAAYGISSLLGSYLGHELVPAQTHEGAVGGQLLGAIGSAIGISAAIGQLLGSVLDFILPGVGSLIGTVLGTIIGDAFGSHPHPAAVDLLDQAGDHYGYGHSSSSDGGGYDIADQMAAATAGIVNGYLAAVNGVVIDHSKQTMVGFVTDPDFRYVNGWTPNHHYYSFISPDDAVHAAALDILQHTEVIGGDLLMKRAHQNSASNVAGPEPEWAGLTTPSSQSGAEQLLTMSADLSVAQDYENYLNNREAINAVMAAYPESAFTAGWIATFARVNDLGLNHMNASDFLGGLVGYLDSVNKAGLGVEAANVTVRRPADNSILVEIKIPNSTEVPGSLSVFSDHINVSSDASGQTVQLTVDSGVVAAGTHFYGPGATAGDGANDLWIGAANAENTFTGTGGHDILVGGAANDVIYGGGGFDFIDGGAGVDYLYGQDGNDILRGGAGIDFLYGGLGNDTYVFNPGDGADTVLDEVSVLTDTSHWKDEWRDDDGDGVSEFHHDWIPEATLVHPDAGTDTLLFGPGITGVTTVLSGNDLIVTVHDAASPNGQDTITLRNWTDPKDRIEFFKFDDGSIWNMAGTGPSTYVIDSTGSARLTLVGSNYFFNTAGTGPTLKYNGAAVVPGMAGAFVPIGAEQTATGYEVAWKNTGADQYTAWSTDANGNFTGYLIGVVSGSSLDLKLLENSFHQDLNGDGRIGVVTTPHPDRNRRVKARAAVRAGGWRRAQRTNASMACIRKRFA
jgi:Ca2+-binding RTX toxin-like protein